MDPRRLSLVQVAFFGLLLLALPVAAFHLASGRPAQGAIAIGAAVAGLLVLRQLMREQRARVAPAPLHSTQPVQTVFVPPPRPAPQREETTALPSTRTRDVLRAGLVALAAQSCVLLVPLALASSVPHTASPLLDRWAVLLAPAASGEALRQLALPTLGLVLASDLPLALGYAQLVRRTRRGSGWLGGLAFALIPWLALCGAWLPLAGGGWFGAGLGAGPLPALDLLAAYLAFGVTLAGGLAGGGRAQSPRAQQPRLGAGSADRGAAGGAVIGLLVGLLLGITIAEAGRGTLPPPPMVVVAAVALIGCSWGVLLGSVAAQRDELGLAPHSRQGQTPPGEALGQRCQEREPHP